MTLDNLENYLKVFEEINQSSNINGIADLQNYRKENWDKFVKTGIPTHRRGNERWEYTNLRPLLDSFHIPSKKDDEDFQKYLQSNIPLIENQIVIVLVNGIFSEKLSSNLKNIKGVRLSTLNDSNFEIEHLYKNSKSNQDPFVSLNYACSNDVISLHVENSNSDLVFNVVNISAGDESYKTINNPRVLIFGEKESVFSVIETFLEVSDSSNSHFSNCVTEIILEEDSLMNHYRILLEQNNSFHIGNTRVYQSQGSEFNSISYSRSPLIGSNEIDVYLQGSTKCTLNGLYLTRGTQHMVNHISINHEKPSSESHQYFKGILSGKSRAIFSGKVLVEKDAQKIFAEQKDLNLLLSRGAEIDTKPSLEIYADDVQCAHGATAGHVDKDTLFYLMSRGLDKKTATGILIKGFADEIINGILLDELRFFIQDDLGNLLPELNFEG
jgi:Fe-S cluster assembly protein SufD